MATRSRRSFGVLERRIAPISFSAGTAAAVTPASMRLATEIPRASAILAKVWRLAFFTSRSI